MLLIREVLFYIHTFFFVRCSLQIFLLMIFRLTFPCISYSLSMAEKDLILWTRCKLDLLGLLEIFKNAKPLIHYFLIISLRKRSKLFTLQNNSIKIVLCEDCWKCLSVVGKGTYTIMHMWKTITNCRDCKIRHQENNTDQISPWFFVWKPYNFVTLHNMNVTSLIMENTLWYNCPLHGQHLELCNEILCRYIIAAVRKLM